MGTKTEKTCDGCKRAIRDGEVLGSAGVTLLELDAEGSRRRYGDLVRSEHEFDLCGDCLGRPLVLRDLFAKPPAPPKAGDEVIGELVDGRIASVIDGVVRVTVDGLEGFRTFDVDELEPAVLSYSSDAAAWKIVASRRGKRRRRNA